MILNLAFRQRIFRDKSPVSKEDQFFLEVTVMIRECLKGNRIAQRALFEALSPGMMAVCKRYGRNQQEAEDILQEGFIKLFHHLDQYRGKGAFEGWVRRIFVNTAIKYYHKNRKHHNPVSLDHIHYATVLPKAPELLSEKEMLQLIKSLPEGYQMVFNLYVIEGYSHREIAEMLRIGESTSRSQLVKARRLLKEQFLSLQKIAL